MTCKAPVQNMLDTRRKLLINSVFSYDSHRKHRERSPCARV